MSSHTQNTPVNAPNGSSLPALSDSFENLVVLHRSAHKESKKALPRHPESWGKLPSFGTDISLCTACNEVFKSVGGFDAHRKGEEDRYCLTPDEMRQAGMSINDRGMWIKTEFVPFAVQQIPKEVAAS